MKLLLDTHIWLWYCLGSTDLPENLKVAIAAPNNELWLSPMSVWETLMLAEKGRIFLAPDAVTWINAATKALGTQEASLNQTIAILSRQLACPHQDPIDRFLAATAIYHGLQLVTVDQNLLDTPSLEIFGDADSDSDE
ncbi:MAG: type II toxin-antitoxin system VapC family toxin [Leptolyngbya sp. SIO3F4]|nr:type II toxin-antitoxin system VapC family toxin [Leptolyngbya sp. SIO3F4]